MNGHPQYDEDFELYALGVLDGSDKTELEAHLAGCAECRAKLESVRSRLGLLALGVPLMDLPTSARERILGDFRASLPERREGTQPQTARRGFWTSPWAWALAGVSLLLLVAAVWTARDRSLLSHRLAELELTHKQLATSSIELKAAAARAQAVLDVLTGPQTIQVDLSPQTAHPVPHGKAFYNPAHGLLFYTTNLSSLPTDKTYELWLIPTEGKPVDAGLFNTDAQGNGQVLLPSLPQGLSAKAFAVTVEPAGGVPAPTGAMVLVGPVS